MPKRDLWNDNSIQFPRLLAEILAAGCIEGELLDTVCDSMDLTPTDVYELFDRAETEWQRLKEVNCPRLKAPDYDKPY